MRTFNARMHCKEKEEYCRYLFVPACCSNYEEKYYPMSYAGCENHRDYSFIEKGVEQQCVDHQGLDGKPSIPGRDGCTQEMQDFLVNKDSMDSMEQMEIMLENHLF